MPDQVDSGYHILAAVGAEAQLSPLLMVGCALAKARGGRVTVLSVTATGHRPAWLNVPELRGGTTVSVVVRTGRDPGAGILQVAHDSSPEGPARVEGVHIAPVYVGLPEFITVKCKVFILKLLYLAFKPFTIGKLNPVEAA